MKASRHDHPDGPTERDRVLLVRLERAAKRNAIDAGMTAAARRPETNGLMAEHRAGVTDG